MRKINQKMQKTKEIQTVKQEEPNIELSTLQYNDYKKFDIALLNLTESYHPACISSRDDEKIYIQSFIKEGIKSNGSSQTLYVSGVPGIGKTICVEQVVNQIKIKYKIKEQNQKYSPKVIFINGMSLKKPKDIFTKILSELCQNSVRSLNAMYFLNDFFSKGYSTSQRDIEIFAPKILVIDEIDYLYTRDEEVIYSILQWTQYKNSRLILIAISNTIDFPETLSSKICSRMGNKRLVFKPYNSLQIQKILKQRIAKLDIFEEQSIQFMCKKIAKCSSDIRKSLYVLRQSIIVFLQQFGLRQKIEGKVPISILTKVYQQSFNDGFIRHFSRFHYTFKTILFILAKYFKHQNTPITYTQLQKKCNSFLKFKVNIHSLLVDMRNAGYIDLKFDTTKIDKRINRNIDIYRQYEEQHITLLLTVDNVLYAASQDQKGMFSIQD